jgi:LCP family protein required for cell wall assembly
MAAPAEVRLRRTWPQRLLIAFNVVLILLCLTGAGGLGYFYYKFGNLERVPLAKGILTPEEPPGEPQNFLLVGSDSRAFVEEDAERESFGSESDTGGQRADTIILVRVDPRTKHAAMVSFPRDLYVPIAPDGHHQRINTAFTNGPQQLIETIKTDFNIPIHHYAQVDFKGFQGLVDAVGGVIVYLASPVRDRVTGLHVVKTGCVELGGGQALAYVRSRHFQYLEDGRWKTDPRGDLGRIERQQDFIRRALREALSKGLTNPARLNRLVNVGLKNVQVSKSLDLRDIVNLGKNFRSLAPDTLSQYSLPVTSGRTSAGASVLRIEEDDQDEAERIFDVFRGTPPPSSQPVEPSAVSLRVLNGSGIGGQAGETSSALQQHQFTVGTPGNTSQGSRTTIRYGSGQEAKAHLLARYLVSGADIVPSSSLRSVDLELVTGSDFEGVRATPLPATATTVTITPPTTTPPPAAPPC